MVEQFAVSGDPDQTPRSVASDLGLHSLPNTLLGVFRLKWVNEKCQVRVTTCECVKLLDVWQTV